jgi:hypothetical protein
MDPITTAIVSVLTDLARSSATDAYEGLKTIIRRKWGSASPIARAVDALEADPHSKGQAMVLSEKVEAARAAEDPDIAAALTLLNAELNGGGGDIRVTVGSGGTVHGVVGAKKVSIGTMSFGNCSRDRSS